MRLAETVTFGGSDLDRAAAWRGDSGRIDAAWAQGRVIRSGGERCFFGLAKCPLWAGFLPRIRFWAMMPDCIFLGLHHGQALFAADLTGWIPPANEAAVQAGFFDASEQRHPALGDDHALSNCGA